MPNTKIAIFKGKKIRKTLHQNEWWFSVVDVAEVLTDSPDAGAYWRKLKQRLNEEGSEVVTFCHGLKLEAADGNRQFDFNYGEFARIKKQVLIRDERGDNKNFKPPEFEGFRKQAVFIHQAVLC